MRGKETNGLYLYRCDRPLGEGRGGTQLLTAPLQQVARTITDMQKRKQNKRVGSKASTYKLHQTCIQTQTKKAVEILCKLLIISTSSTEGGKNTSTTEESGGVLWRLYPKFRRLLLRIFSAICSVE